MTATQRRCASALLLRRLAATRARIGSPRVARPACRAAPWQKARVTEAVKKLKEKGFVSPYLRTFVVARINPLRWIQGEPPPLEDVLKTMRERAGKFNTEKVKQEDLAAAGGAMQDARDFHAVWVC